MLINCPECGTKVSDKADNCPNCAYPLKKKEPGQQEGCFLQTLNFGCVVVVVIIILIMLAVIFT